MKAVNLIPGEQRAGAGGITGRSSGGALIVLALMAGFAALALLYGSAQRQISSQSGEAASFSAQTSALEARTGRLAPYTAFVSMAEQRMQTVSGLVQARFDWSHALHELGRVLPTSASLNSLHGSVGSVGQTSGSSSSSSSSAAAAASAPATSSTPPGSTPIFTLTGCATSQSEVAQTLQRLRLIDGVEQVQLQSSTKSGATNTSSSSGGCGGNDPAFSLEMVFTDLPSATVTATHTSGATQIVATSGGPR
jgi:Tfp pilus assembly protein PilN